MNGIHPLLLPANTPEDAAALLLNAKGRGRFVVTLNFELIARGASSSEFAAIAEIADGRICDGSGGRLLLSLSHPKARIPRIPGIDLGFALLRLAAKRGLSVFLLGGKPGVACKAADNLRKAIPALQIVGTAHGYFQKADLPALRGMIRASGAELVFVCLGSPRQEEWIVQNRRYLPSVRLFLPLGGSLDVWAKEVSRAPRVFQKAGAEWVWRIARDPRRLVRLWRAGVLLFTARASIADGFVPKMRNIVSN